MDYSRIQKLQPYLIQAISQLEEQHPLKGFNSVTITVKVLELVPQDLKDASTQIMIGFTFVTLIKTSKLLFDSKASSFRLTPMEGYLSFEQLVEMRYKGYELDNQNSFQPKGAPTLNLSQLAEIHLSPASPLNEKVLKFEELLTQNDNSLLLDSSSDKFEPILLASYPRCGSSFSRKLIEQVTGIATGSIFPSSRLASFQLLILGSKGEGIVDGRAKIFKTHFPLFAKLSPAPLLSKKAIVIVRNPIDAFISQFTFMSMDMMNYGFKNSIPEEFQDIFATFIKHACALYKTFGKFWKEKAESMKYPVHIMRYEDIIDRKEETLSEAFEFFYNQDINATYLKERIKRVCQDEKSGVVYKPRNADKVDNLSNYKEDIIQYIKEQLKEELIFFGYHKSEENLNSVFDYGKQEAQLGFRYTNSMQKKVLKLNPEDITPIDSKNDDGINIEQMIAIRTIVLQIQERLKVSY